MCEGDVHAGEASDIHSAKLKLRRPRLPWVVYATSLFLRASAASSALGPVDVESRRDLRLNKSRRERKLERAAWGRSSKEGQRLWRAAPWPRGAMIGAGVVSWGRRSTRPTTTGDELLLAGPHPAERLRAAARRCSLGLSPSPLEP